MSTCFIQMTSILHKYVKWFHLTDYTNQSSRLYTMKIMDLKCKAYSILVRSVIIYQAQNPPTLLRCNPSLLSQLCKEEHKTGVTLQENDQQRSDVMQLEANGVALNTASRHAALHHPVVDYFPITACPIVFCCFYTTAMGHF